MILKYRPHHFLCTLGFIGMGYSPEFIQNFEKIVSILKKPDGDDTEIKVIFTADSICIPCPNKRDDGCKSQARINRLDKAHATALQIKDGDTLTWSEAKKRIAKNISLDEFNKICAPCPWKQHGVCEKALENNSHSKKIPYGP
jgi:uncharacterized protein